MTLCAILYHLYNLKTEKREFFDKIAVLKNIIMVPSIFSWWALPY